MRALVTGANGFVGSALCRKLLQRGNRVRGLVRASSDLSLLGDLPIQLVPGDVRDPASLVEAMRGVDVVYHAAGAVSDWGPLEWFRQVNVYGTRNLLEAAASNGVRRVVYVSSVAVHNFIGAQDMDETSPQGPTPFPYSQSKREAEALALEYHQRGRVAVSIVRPGDIYGPGDRVALLRLAGLLRRGLLPYIDGGRALGAFTYVENLADGLILAGEIPAAEGEVYVITDGTKLTWRGYFEGLTTALGWPRPWLSIPKPMAWGIASVLEEVYRCIAPRCRPLVTRYLVDHLAHDFYFEITKARRELGYVPAVETAEAIRRTAEWLRMVIEEGRMA